MTPGAGTAHVVGRVACRRMRAGRRPVCGFVADGLRFFVGRFAALRRSSGRHKWRPYVCGWLNAVSRRLVCGVARGGAIHDARCRNGTCGRSRCVSTDAGGAAVGSRFCGGRLRFFIGRFAALRRLSGRHKWRPYVCGRLNAVSRRSFGRHKWRPYVCGWLNAVLWRSFGRHKWRPYVCGWLIVVSRRPVCGVVRGGAIYDARCRNGTCGRSRCVSVDAGGASVGSRHCVGYPGVTSGAPTFAGG